MILPRIPTRTVSFVDDYCQEYQKIFPEVRSYENFKFLHIGLISELTRKSLPEIAKYVGLKDSQSLNNFIKNSPWDVNLLREQRLSLLKKHLGNRRFILVINEIGDKKKGKTTDYVAKQYIGQFGKTENGIVTINAYGILDGMTFPLIFKVFKPKNTLLEGDDYQSKHDLALGIIKKLLQRGFQFDTVIADSVYGRNKDFLQVLNRLSLNFIVPLKISPISTIETTYRGFYHENSQSILTSQSNFFNNRGMSQAQLNGIFDHKHSDALIEYTDDYISAVTNIPESMSQKLAHLLILLAWTEYKLKEVIKELGWTDFRITNYQSIERWWEIVLSAYSMVSLQSDVFQKKWQMDLFVPPETQLMAELASQNRSGDEETIWQERLHKLVKSISLNEGQKSAHWAIAAASRNN
ncbi:IS701 family transposase [Merismopedia glauca]|uniref:IS701 family transposase n=1 Tax=Merismopedia glauca CCAP 1448/3 TaxID=1296344 RepID=A0A2T1C929_9CYAN|nr:transposase [Merismopedia glauca]PSB04751.1 IS701 family transposase [Merismopedia glauca CCAP 1448/3]